MTMPLPVAAAPAAERKDEPAKAPLAASPTQAKPRELAASPERPDVDIDAEPEAGPDAALDLDAAALMRNKSLSVDRSSRPHFKEGIRLAEMGKWSTLVERLERGETQLARHRDHHGMLPLHWACTEDDVPAAAVRALLLAFPDAVLTRNNAQYLPLHLAVRARVGAATLRALVAARPSSLLVETPAGKTALALAREAALPLETMNMLEGFEREYRELSADSDDDDNARLETAKREIALQSQRLRESMLHPPLMTNGSNSSSNAIGAVRASTAGFDASASFGPLDMVHASFGGPAGPLDAIAADVARASGQSFNSQSGSSASAPMVTSLSFVGGSLVQQPKDSFRIEEEVATPGGSLVPGPAPPAPTTGPAAARPSNHEPVKAGSGGAVPLPSSQRQLQPQQHQHSQGDRVLGPSVYESDHESGVCGVCYRKFNMFRKKYQCKSCFTYLCKKHVAGKVELPTFAKKRSVCGDCYRVYRRGPVPHPLPGSSTATASSTIVSSAVSSSNGSATAAAAHANSISGPLRPQTGTTLSLPPTRTASEVSATASARSLSSASSAPGMNGGNGGNGGPPLMNPLGSSRMMNRMARAESTHSIVGRPSTVVGPQTSMRFSSTAAVRSRGQSGALTIRSRGNSSLLQSDGGGGAALSMADMLDPRPSASAAEVAALHQRIATLEECNKVLLTRVQEQEKQYDEAMLLLTQTMTRVAEMELRVPSERKSYRGTGGSTTASERASELLEGDIKFSFPTPFTEKFD